MCLLSSYLRVSKHADRRVETRATEGKRRTQSSSLFLPQIIFILGLKLQCRAGMCVNLSQPVSCSSSFFSPPSLHPLPSLWFELDNENNEFGVCFFLWLSRPPPTSFSSHGDPVSDSQPPTSLSLLFHFCLHVFKV